MERMAADAAYSRLHEKAPWHNGTFEDWSKDASEEHPYRADFGVTFGVADTDLRPEDRFLSDEPDENFET